MADRGMTAAVLAELTKSQVAPFFLVEFYFSSGTVYRTNAGNQISWSGHTYEPLGGLLRFDNIAETGELLINRVTVSIDDVDLALFAKYTAEEYLDRQIKIYLLFMTEAGAVISNPLIIFDGRMDSPTFQQDPNGGNITATIDGVPVWAESGRTPGRHANQADQDYFFAGVGDVGFEFVSEIPKVLLWGRN